MTIEVDRVSAPAAGPYVPAFDAGAYVFCSGQLPLNPATGELVADDIEAQTERAIDNMGAVLRSIGSGLEQVVKTTVFLKTLDDFERMNAAYGRRFGAVRPARSTVGGVTLPRGARIEIEAIARHAGGQESEA